MKKKGLNLGHWRVICFLFLSGVLVEMGNPTQVLAQQNIQFTQYIFNSLSVNPAYAGYKEEWFAQLALRSQWVSMEGAPKTGQLSLDGILDPQDKKMGAGIQITSDKLGPETATSMYLNYAYRIRLDEQDSRRLSFGIGAGFTQYGLDGRKLDPMEDDDQALPFGKENYFKPDLRFGVYYYSSKWYIGASVMDLLGNKNSKSQFSGSSHENYKINYKRHFYLITGALLPLSVDLDIRPSLLIKDDFKGPTSVDLNAMLIFGGRFWIGGGYRTGMSIWGKNRDQEGRLSRLNSFSGVTEFYINDRLRVGYSYDYVLSRLSSLQNGTHEITLGLTFPGKLNRLLSPRFF